MAPAARLTRLPSWARRVKAGDGCPIRGGVTRVFVAARTEETEAMVTKVAYEERPPRYEYRLTQKGREFWSVLAAMWRWGEDWLWDDDGPQVVLKDRETGRVVRPLVVDEATGEPIDVRTLRMGRPPRSWTPAPRPSASP